MKAMGHLAWRSDHTSWTCALVFRARHRWVAQACHERPQQKARSQGVYCWAFSDAIFTKDSGMDFTLQRLASSEWFGCLAGKERSKLQHATMLGRH